MSDTKFSFSSEEKDFLLMVLDFWHEGLEDELTYAKPYPEDIFSTTESLVADYCICNTLRIRLRNELLPHVD